MIVYKATNINNNKVYIGITTKTLEHRMKIHKKDSKRKDTYFYKAIRKYGWDAFVWEVIDTANSIDELHEKEIYYISQYESFNNKEKGYNTTSGGGSLYKITDEERKARSERAKGENNPMYGVPSPMLGKKFTEEHKAKISKALTGKKHPSTTGGKNPAARIVINLNTNEVFDTMKEAALKCKVSVDSIRQVCKKQKESVKGIRWEYVL